MPYLFLFHYIVFFALAVAVRSFVRSPVCISASVSIYSTCAHEYTLPLLHHSMWYVHNIRESNETQPVAHSLSSQYRTPITMWNHDVHRIVNALTTLITARSNCSTTIWRKTRETIRKSFEDGIELMKNRQPVLNLNRFTKLEFLRWTASCQFVRWHVNATIGHDRVAMARTYSIRIGPFYDWMFDRLVIIYFSLSRQLWLAAIGYGGC